MQSFLLNPVLKSKPKVSQILVNDRFGDQQPTFMIVQVISNRCSGIMN